MGGGITCTKEERVGNRTADGGKNINDKSFSDQ